MELCWSRITDAQLEGISDMPWSDNELALERLKSFRDQGPPVSTEAWDHSPVEALELMRWKTLDEGDGRYLDGFDLREWHGMRLTACATLTYCEAMELSADHSPGATALKLAQSAMFLGPQVAEEALYFIAWSLQAYCSTSHNIDDLRAILAICCLGLASRCLDAEAITRLLDWAEWCEGALAEEAGAPEGAWLLRLSDWHPAQDCLVCMVEVIHGGVAGATEAEAALGRRLLGLVG